MSNLGTLTLDLVAKTGNFTAGMTKAERQAKQSSANISKYAANMTKGIAIGAAAAATAILAVVAATTAMVNKNRELIDSEAKSARQLETTYSAYVTLKQAAGDAGVGMAQLESASRTLNRELGKALSGNPKQVQAFKNLGLTAAQVAAVPLDKRIGMINKALVENVNANQRASKAAEIFGSRNAASIALLDAEGIEEAAHQLDIFGLRLSEIDVAKVEIANGTMDNFGLLVEGIGKQLAVEFTPILHAVNEAFMQTSEEAGGLGTVVSDTVDSVLENLFAMANGADAAFKYIGMGVDGLITIFAS